MDGAGGIALEFFLFEGLVALFVLVLDSLFDNQSI